MTRVRGPGRQVGEYPNTGGRKFVAPSSGEKDDWALVLEDAAKKYPTEPAK